MKQKKRKPAAAGTGAGSRRQRRKSGDAEIYHSTTEQSTIIPPTAEESAEARKREYAQGEVEEALTEPVEPTMEPVEPVEAHDPVAPDLTEADCNQSEPPPAAETSAEGGAAATGHRFVVTMFDDITGEDLIDREFSLDELRTLVLDTTARQKPQLPLLKLANFGIERSPENSLRHNANVVSITGIEGDYDDKKMPFDRAVELLSQARLNALVYTSPSYTASAPKWRVILPTSQDLPPSARTQLVARVNGVLGGVLASESFTLSQAYYYGSINGNPDHRAEIVAGDHIDLRDALDAGAIGKKRKRPDNPDNGGPTGKTDKQTDDPDLIYAAMAVIPNDEAVDWVEWNRMGMACWLATAGADRGFEAFAMWSAKSTVYDETNTQERWQRYFTSPPTEIGAGTIFLKADQAQPGWRALVDLPIEKIDEILRLSRLSAAQYDIERREVAKQLNFSSVSTLDDIVDRLRPRTPIDDDDNRQGTRIEFAVFEPWPDAVEGETLIADMTNTIRARQTIAESGPA